MAKSLRIFSSFMTGPRSFGLHGHSLFNLTECVMFALIVKSLFDLSGSNYPDHDPHQVFTRDKILRSRLRCRSMFFM